MRSDWVIRYLGESLLEPGEDSTKNYMQNFVRIMVNQPEEQEKAQEEIDRVVGRDRMPTADDIPHLPYVQAIVREVNAENPTREQKINLIVLKGHPFQTICTPRSAAQGDRRCCGTFSVDLELKHDTLV